MNRNQIEYILTLAKMKNFGQAADACFITQSTLSAMVAKFEEQIGITIFNRKTRPISITNQGEEVIQSIKNIMREYQLLEDKINKVKGIEHANLSIAAIPTVAPYLYPLILDKISAQFPNINFKIHELTTENTVKEILAGNIELGIISTPLNNKDLLEHHLYYEDFLLYDCGSKFKQSKIKVADIDLNRLWLMEEGHCLRNQVGKICELRQQKKINGNLTYNCGTLYTLLEMVKRNKGVTLLPRLAIANNNQIKKANIYPIQSPIPTREIGIISHKNFTKTKILNHLITEIQDAVKKHLPNNRKKSKLITPF